MAKKRKKTLKTYYVELVNHNDRNDNEAVRVKAYSPSDARQRVSCDFNRFGIRYIIWAGSRNSWDKWYLKHLRSMCSR